MAKRKNTVKKSGFSLIELSIVLIIIGLLIAGVTGGASLIKSSELRAVTGEARAWAISVNGFYNQFNNLPGDYATDVGGTNAGDGDGTIEGYYASSHSEGRAAWWQMKSAGIIDSTVVSNPSKALTAAVGSSQFGVIVPASKIKSSGWELDYNSSATQNVVVLTGVETGAFSSSNTVYNGTSVASGAITPTDALSIDAKIDDGLASSGKVRGVLADCFSSNTYTTTDSDKECALSYQVDVNT